MIHIAHTIFSMIHKKILFWKFDLVYLYSCMFFLSNNMPHPHFTKLRPSWNVAKTVEDNTFCGILLDRVIVVVKHMDNNGIMNFHSSLGKRKKCRKLCLCHIRFQIPSNISWISNIMTKIIPRYGWCAIIIQIPYWRNIKLWSKKIAL